MIGKSRSRLNGEVTTAIPIAWQNIGFLMFGAVAAAILFLSLASYSRVEAVAGAIIPESGIVTITPSRAGIISQLFITDGQIVQAHHELASIRSEEDAAAKQTPNELIEIAIARQAANLSLQSSAMQASARAQTSQLAAQRAGLVAEISQLQAQIDTQHALIISAQSDLDRARAIAERGFISGRDIQIREETLLSRQQGLAQLEQSLAAKRAALGENANIAAQIAEQARAQTASIEATRAQVAQQAASTAGSRSYVLRAPIAGRVTALSARIGQAVSPQGQLMAIVPTNSKLRVELIVPSTAIGFVKPGQEVRLAIDAFPYQRFGTIKGRVQTVAASAISAQGPNGTTFAAYPVTVALNQYRLNAYGRAEPLVSGMTLTARIITEKQSLLQWLFEPLFAVQRR